ncbi:substrate-binding periplasmic protein [Chitinimonas sp. BJB300]|uniref:substrate-binding periplasmic protein n=1 Tax=Chitinimonas sp. BJB300 TaxID=1559339 RepID=UPI000C0F171B|nr:transporter substrate-binding domain-containing protein [Chitinimonas sp. BJB300]PHV10390.1 hypothetical protein CSQ89_16475 [Chitinimonas sp. BJB300]TSJ87521.1 amino acid ABC transporter substrate-binding protein [Chitinimonas sp. BJB300]
MKSFPLFVCFSLLLSTFTPAASLDEPITIPLLITEPLAAHSHQLQSQEIKQQQQLMDLIAAEAGLRFELKPYPWRRALRLAERGKGLLWEVSYTPDRARFFAFSAPVTKSIVWMVVPAGNAFPYRGIHSLRGKTVAIGGGEFYGKDFETYRGKLFTVEDNADSLKARINMLARGRVDVVLFISLHEAASQFKAQLKDADDIGNWEVLPQPLSIDSVYIGAAHKSPYKQYLPIINRAITRLHQRGAISAVVNQLTTDPVDHSSLILRESLPLVVE